VPQIVPLSLIVNRSTDLVISAGKFAVYPAGFEFELTTLSRTARSLHPMPWAMPHGRGSGALIGVEYANGAKATLPPQPTPGAQGMTMLPRSGSGDETTHRQTIWVSPLPPDGPVTIAAAWPARGLAEATITVDGGQFRNAAENAIELWPDATDEAVEVDFNDAPPLPVEGVRPADAEAAEAAIRAAFAQVFDNGPQAAADPLAAVQDGAVLSGALAEVRSRFPMEAATSRVAVGRIVFLDEVRAAVIFRFVVRTALAGFGSQLGYAVRVQGEWKVARDTYCRVLGWAGVQCPPPPPPV
jgi:hypothetical protein